MASASGSVLPLSAQKNRPVDGLADIRRCSDYVRFPPKADMRLRRRHPPPQQGLPAKIRGRLPPSFAGFSTVISCPCTPPGSPVNQFGQFFGSIGSGVGDCDDVSWDDGIATVVGTEPGAETVISGRVAVPGPAATEATL